MDFYFKFGSKKLELPFAIRLNDFIAEKYPGTDKSTLGIMAFLGYLDFGSDMMNATTWSLLIIAAILGIFLGKRWS